MLVEVLVGDARVSEDGVMGVLGMYVYLWQAVQICNMD